MKSTVKLALRREVLAQLEPADLRSVDGGAQTRTCTTTIGPVSDTCYSCLTYVSCYQTDCIGR